jgi:hypothetical protein
MNEYLHKLLLPFLETRLKADYLTQLCRLMLGVVDVDIQSDRS